MQMGPRMPPPPLVPPGALPQPKTSGKKWARSLILLGLLFSTVSTLALGCFAAQSVLRYQRYEQWPKTTAVYDGMSSKTTGSGKSRTTSCTRWYQYSLAGQEKRAYADSPCRVIFGPDPEVGERIEIAYHPASGNTCLSAVEIYAVGGYPFLGMLLVLFGLGMMAVGVVIGLVGWARRRKHPPTYAQPPPASPYGPG